MALSIDTGGSGSFRTFQTNTTLTTAAFQTSNLSGLIIVVCLVLNGDTGAPVTVTSASATFTRRDSVLAGGAAGFPTQMWTAPVLSPPFNDTITITQASSALIAVDVFAVIGAYANNPQPSWDGASVSAQTGYPSITTAATNTILISTLRDTNSAVNTGSVWSPIQGGTINMVTQYKILAAPTTTAVTVTSGTSGNGALVSAISADAPGVAPILMGAICL